MRDINRLDKFYDELKEIHKKHFFKDHIKENGYDKKDNPS